MRPLFFPQANNFLDEDCSMRFFEYGSFLFCGSDGSRDLFCRQVFKVSVGIDQSILGGLRRKQTNLPRPDEAVDQWILDKILVARPPLRVALVWKVRNLGPLLLKW